MHKYDKYMPNTSEYLYGKLTIKTKEIKKFLYIKMLMLIKNFYHLQFANLKAKWPYENVQAALFTNA